MNASGEAAKVALEPAADVVLVLTTVPDEAVAERIARLLVEDGLAACVHEIEIAASTYRWQGEIARSAETKLVIKTVRQALPALAARLRALHPYELPELLVVEPAAGGADYLAWVRAAVTAGR